jgi:hypothetical protein
MKNNSTLAPLRIITRKFAVGIILASGTFALGQLNHSGAFDDRNEGQHKRCSNRTLTGDYGIQIEGNRTDVNDATLRTLVLAHFHGDGTLTEIDHVVFNGQPPDEEWRPSTGTYSVNPDCTGSASIDVAPGFPPLGYHFIVVNQGRKFILVVDGGAINGVAYKVD